MTGPFIELHAFTGGEPVFINLSTVLTLGPAVTSGCVIIQVGYDGEFIVAESYAEVKRRINATVNAYWNPRIFVHEATGIPGESLEVNPIKE